MRRRSSSHPIQASRARRRRAHAANLRIPGQTDHRFRPKPITDSDSNRSPIPVETDHLQSGLSDAGQPRRRGILPAFAGGTEAGEQEVVHAEDSRGTSLYFAAALSIRAIARSLGTSPSTVGEHLRRAKVAGVSWAVPEALDDAGLERRLFPALPSSHTSRPLPDWSEVRRELRGKNVTLALLWQEYKAIHPEGLQYSRFCEQSREWAGKLDLVMRQEHRAGEKLFIDYAGQTVPVVDPETGEVRQAQVFVAVLGASSYTFAEATWTQSLPDWTASHVRAFEFYGGCPELVIPDNLRSGDQPRPSLRAGPESDLSRPRPPLRRGGAAHAGAPPKGRRRRRRWLFKSSSGGYSPRFAIARSSRWPSSTPRSPSCSTGSTRARSASSRGRGARSSSSSISRRCIRCLPARTSSPSGRPCACTSTTTWKSTATTTRFPTRWSGANSTSD